MLLKELREKNPQVKLYAFQCIMRCPKYSSDDEEPDYYELYGKEIHHIGDAARFPKTALVTRTSFPPRLTTSISARSTLWRTARLIFSSSHSNIRRSAARPTSAAVEGRRSSTIDFLIIPQDDSAKYGYTAMDQKTVRAKIDEKVLNDRVILYPGADELGMVLVSRAINALENNTPRVYLKYASTLAPQLIPNYEDRSLNETVKYHVMAAGCIAVPSLADADVVMGITAPANEMEEAANQPANNINYDVERNMAEFLYFVNDCLKRGIPTAILDNAYTNGGELQLLRVLNKQGILMKLAGYAGWNTSANSMGTVLAMIVNNMYQNNTEAKQNFLVERFIEDFGYGAVVRSYVTEHILPQWGMTYFWCEEQRGKAANAVLEELRKFVKTEMTSVADKVTVEDIFLPWSRMFEIGLKATYKAD